MAIAHETTALHELDVCSFRQLTDSLRKDDSWKKVAEFVRIYDQNEISSLSKTACPAESLLNELGTKLCTVETLRVIFKQCCLYEALSVISEPEPMQIIRQPTDILEGKNKLSVPIGEELTLEFQVSGVPPPKFHWFKDDQVLIHQTASVLHFDRYSCDMEGEYVCYATQVDGSYTAKISSETVNVETFPLSCEVLEKPDEFLYLCEGSPILLKVTVTGYPKPSFQWLHDNQILDNEDKDVLCIKSAQKRHNGMYRCFVSNRVSDVTIKTCVVIYEEKTIEIYKTPLSDKVALLIANDEYENLENLISPSNDVMTVAKMLQTLGFKTICLQNLNLHELKVAIELFGNFIDDDCFAFLYYAGHGFEMGDRFLLPIDSPGANTFKKIDAVSESMILQTILNKQPILFVLLLDMCLRLPDKSENPQIYEEIYHFYKYESNRNLIRGYSTTSHLVSYEYEDSLNGVYVNSLKKYLGKNLPILTILGKVNAEISLKLPEQMPTISYITFQDFYLNNPIRGFYEDKKNYRDLNINDETTSINKATIRLGKFKQFNNVLQIAISNVETVEYSANVEVKETKTGDETILQVPKLQRMEDTVFNMELKIDDIDFVICKRFEIANIFLDC